MPTYYVPYVPRHSFFPDWVTDLNSCPVPPERFPFAMQLAFNPNLVQSLFFLTIGTEHELQLCNWISCYPFYVIAETTKQACCGMVGTFAFTFAFTSQTFDYSLCPSPLRMGDWSRKLSRATRNHPNSNWVGLESESGTKIVFRHNWLCTEHKLQL